ncbi:hypothetical protein H9P43_005433 [Blastocladiella emersonii ATCC 22665]|nr:hypothetical protein H9P43_005433 [Blastocladiella emersonii ATCC 22665]
MLSTHSTLVTSCNRLHRHPSASMHLASTRIRPGATTGPRRTVAPTPSTSTSSCGGTRGVRGKVLTSILTKFATWAPSTPSRGDQGRAVARPVDSRTARSSPRASVYHDKLLRRSPINWSALLSSTHPTAYSFIIEFMASKLTNLPSWPKAPAAAGSRTGPRCTRGVTAICG